MTRGDDPLHRHKLRTLELLVHLANAILQDLQKAFLSDRQTVIALAFRQCAEFADAVHLLSTEAISGPAASLARTCIETAAHCAFLTHDDSAIRVAAYEVSSYLAELQSLQKRLDTPTCGEQDRQDLEALVSQITQALCDPNHSAPWRAAHDELRKQKGRIVWYEVDGGPRNIHEMLKRTDLGALSALYGDMNATVHGGNRHAIAAIEQAGTWLPGLRAPSPFASQNLFVATVALHTATINVTALCGESSPQTIRRFLDFGTDHERRMREVGWLTN